MNWLAIGPMESWKRALELGTWGMTERYEHFWLRVSPKDTLFFYITNPIKGVVGYGTITEKFRENKPLWAEEVQENRVLWPLRLRFETTFCLTSVQWETGRLRLNSRQAILQKGFQGLRDEVTAMILKELKIGRKA